MARTRGLHRTAVCAAGRRAFGRPLGAEVRELLREDAQDELGHAARNAAELQALVDERPG